MFLKINSFITKKRLKYLSFYSYANDSFVINQWKDVSEIKCQEFSRCLSTGPDVLDYFHIYPVN